MSNQTKQTATIIATLCLEPADLERIDAIRRGMERWSSELPSETGAQPIKPSREAVIYSLVMASLTSGEFTHWIERGQP